MYRCTRGGRQLIQCIQVKGRAMKTPLEYLKPTLRKLNNAYIARQSDFSARSFNPALVSFLSEPADWAIRGDGINYKKGLINSGKKNNFETVDSLFESQGSILHFGSQFMWQNLYKSIPGNSKVVLSFFHGKHNDGKEISENIDFVIRHQRNLSIIHTAASIVENRLIGWGINPKSIKKIPLSIDKDIFQPSTIEKKLEMRRRLGFDSTQLIIGSFQKDGVGWGMGNVPKLIKGPDIFLETIKILSRDFNIAVLLTGPARGYVIQGLEKYAIPYRHTYLQKHSDVSALYSALDAYLITSREEGGPKGLLEAMATNVPVISTPVGMSSDVIKDGVNGFLTNDFEPEALAQKFVSFQKLSSKKDLIDHAHEDIKKYSVDLIAKRMWDEIYYPTMMELA